MKIEVGRYRRKSDGRSVWIINAIHNEPYPLIVVRRPKGAFYETKTITYRGFMARHEKVRDNGL